MTRPLAAIGFVYLFVLVCTGIFGYNFAVAAGVVCLCMLAVSFCIRNIRQTVLVPAILLTAAVACFSYCYSFSAVVRPVAAMAGSRLTVTGQIMEEPEYANERYYYLLKVTQTNLSGAPVDFKMRVSSKLKWEAEPFDTVTAQVQMLEQEISYYWSQGIFLRGYLIGEASVTVAESRPFYYMVIEARRYAAAALRQMITTEEGELLVGMLLGNRSGISQQTVNDFRDAGVSHLLAVSGMHLSVLSAALMWFLKHLRIPRRIRVIIGMAGVVFFMALTGFSASVNRSGIMMLIYLGAQIFGREADSMNSLGFSVLLLTLCNPFAALDYGLLLSFAATLGILLFYQKAVSWFRIRIEKIKYWYVQKILRKLGESVILSLSASVLTYPVLLFTYGEISLVSPLTNLLIVLPATGAIVCSGFAAFLSAAGWFSFLQYPFGLLAGLLSKYILWCVHWLADLPLASLPANQNFVFLWLGGTLIILGIALCLRRNAHFLRFTAMLSCVSLLTGILSYQVVHLGVVEIGVLDVGNGTCVAVTFRGRGILIGCGGDSLPENTAQNYLKSQGVRQLDLLVIPRLADTEFSGVSSFMDALSADGIILPDGEQTQEVLDADRRLALSGLIQTNCASVELWEKINLETDAGNGCVYIKAGRTEILICTYPGADFYHLPEEWRAADVVVYRGVSQNTVQWMKGKYMVFSDTERGILSAASEQSRGITAVSTSGMGNVVILTRGQGDIMLKRR